MNEINLNHATFTIHPDDEAFEISFDHWSGDGAYTYLRKADCEQLYEFLGNWLRPAQGKGDSDG